MNVPLNRSETGFVLKIGLVGIGFICWIHDLAYRMVNGAMLVNGAVFRATLAIPMSHSMSQA